jgi:hypothetical protein
VVVGAGERMHVCLSISPGVVGLTIARDLLRCCATITFQLLYHKKCIKLAFVMLAVALLPGSVVCWYRVIEASVNLLCPAACLCVIVASQHFILGI